MRKPPSMIGITDLEEIKNYKCFESWEKAEPVPNFAINCEDITHMRFDEDKDADVEENIPIEDLSIVFLQKAEQDYD